MTATPARLGRRQVDVLRAATKPYGLIRFADGGWQADGKTCTEPAKRMAELGMLAEGKRGAVVTGGSWKSHPGTWMGLSAEGERVLREWELANAPAVIAHLRHAAAIRELSAKPGESLGQDLVTLAARDEHLADAAWNMISRVVDGDPIVDDTTGNL